MKKLDRIEGTKALNEGFVIIFGEKHRELLETMGEELIELGLKNGVEWTNSIILKDSRVSNCFEMTTKGIIDQEVSNDLENCMRFYFTEEEITMLKNEAQIDDASGCNNLQGLDKYIRLFSKKIKQSDVNIVKSTPFDYFKEYIINDKYKLTLHGEGGLQLDSYKKKNLEYYKSEGELFYMIEDIARKYHYFGMLLAKDAQAELWIEKIKNNLSQHNNYWLNTTLSQIIYKLIKNKKYADEAMIDIQNVTGVTEGFMTHKQLKEKISKMDFSELPDNLFAKK